MEESQGGGSLGSRGASKGARRNLRAKCKRGVPAALEVEGLHVRKGKAMLPSHLRPNLVQRSVSKCISY